MQCDKCAARMDPVNSFRLSGCLVVAGFVLVASSLAALAFGAVLAATGTSATAQAIRDRNDRAKADAVARLEKLSAPPPVLAEFKQHGRVSEATLAQIPVDERLPIRSVLLDYWAARAGTGAGGLVAAGVGGFVVLALFVFGIPGVLVGLLLVRRRKLWRCVACGYGFERL